jgi:hypothetical protein
MGTLMKHDFHIANETRLICCTLEGEFDIEESIKLAKSLREKAVELELSVLYDARKLQESKSITPVYDFTAKLSSIIGSTVHRKVRVAFLYESGSYDDFWKFYEEASVDRGIVIKVFIDKEEAIGWLSS